MTISRELAIALRTAGVRWNPSSGDRFALLLPSFDDDVYTVSEMTIQAYGPADARVLGFNGTTEWALDSVDFTEALWLPREDQLRELVGPFFRRLDRVGDGFEVTVQFPGRGVEAIPGEDASQAYALAVLARLAAAEAAAGQAAVAGPADRP